MKTQKKYTLGIIGLGHMGGAIAAGAVRNDYLERYEIAVYDPSEHARKDCSIEGFAYLSDVHQLTADSHIILLAVTPQQVEGVLDEIGNDDMDVVLSIVTGVSIAHLQERLHNLSLIHI